MRSYLLTLVLVLIYVSAYSQTISIGEDGVVRCKNVSIGTTQTVFGDTYEVVDRNLLIQRRDEGKDLTKVCVSNVTDMSKIFFEIELFNQPIGNWDVSNVTNMGSMFQGTRFFNQSLINWDVSKVMNMHGMFRYSRFNQPIGSWNVGNVTDMSYMFSGSTTSDLNKFNQPIDNWNVSNVTNMSYMFFYSDFNQSIGNWSTTKVTSMEGMFYFSSFNSSLRNWDVSNVTNMSYMFSYSLFNQPIDKWDVGSVTDMNVMFSNSKFDQPIGSWNVGNVTITSGLFYNTPFNQPIGDWDVGNVIDMNWMFGESVFNQSIENWNVAKVVDMRSMFQNSIFNSPIENWDVSRVTDMTYMFKDSKFNQPIILWCVISIDSEPDNFSTGSELSNQNKPKWGTCPGIPEIVSLQNPANNARGIEPMVAFQWAKDDFATHYRLRLFEGFDPIVLDTLVESNVLILEYELKSSTEYNWQVKGINNSRNLEGEWSSIWRFTTGVSTSIDTDETVNTYNLHQNYPNPFNPTTQIRFSLPEPQQVSIRVYDVNGRMVTELVNNQTFSAGNHQVTFNGTGLSTGIYIYNMTTNTGLTFTRKLILLK